MECVPFMPEEHCIGHGRSIAQQWVVERWACAKRNSQKFTCCYADCLLRTFRPHCLNDMLHKQPTIGEVREAFETSSKSMSPLEHFDRMVKTGIINSRGEVTKLVGGQAEPEPDACRPAQQNN